MATGELAANAKAVLVALLEHEADGISYYGMTAAALGFALGFRPGDARHGNHGTGNVARVMSPAVHVTPAITGLQRRKLVRLAPRRDGLSGTAHGLTDAGRAMAVELRAAGVVAEGARSGWREHLDRSEARGA